MGLVIPRGEQRQEIRRPKWNHPCTQHTQAHTFIGGSSLAHNRPLASASARPVTVLFLSWESINSVYLSIIGRIFTAVREHKTVVNVLSVNRFVNAVKRIRERSGFHRRWLMRRGARFVPDMERVREWEFDTSWPFAGDKERVKRPKRARENPVKQRQILKDAKNCDKNKHHVWIK